KAAVSARGLGSNYLSNRLLLLQNGRPLTDPWTGQFYADETTPLSNVKQIEVIRGPGSSLYGSNAFSGVINIIERRPSDLFRNGRNYGAEARLLAGQYNTYRLNTTAAGKLGPVESSVTYYGLRSDGAQLFNNAQLGIVDENQDTQVNQVAGQLHAGPVSFDINYTDAEIGRPGGQQISTIGNCGRCHYTPNDEEKVQNLSASAQVDQPVTDKLRVFGQVYTFMKRRVVDMENLITGELQPTLAKRRRVGGEARALLSLGKATLTFGGDVKRDDVNSQNVLPDLQEADGQGLLNEFILGTYVDAEFRPLQKLTLGAGARYDRYELPDNVWTRQTDQVSPRVSAVYHATQALTFRTNYGRAFRAPALAELAINQQMYAATLVGNPNLRAETLDTVEAAVDVWPFDRTVRLTGTGFYNLARNFINQELVFGSVSQFTNVGDARVLGLELEAAAQVPALRSSFDIAYQYLDAQSLAFEGRPQQRLDYAPRHRVYLRGRTAIGQYVFAELYALYVGARFDPGLVANADTGASERLRLPGYLTASARVGANVTQNVAVSLLGTNIFNTTYEESHGFPANPVSIFGELKVSY
ncbi:MAG TPA: TonB-dependent receptor, partial [Myxococcaceae bacterium]|nr:TonB-dependent receptor [Myxococcaceae bacterium]